MPRAGTGAGKASVEMPSWFDALNRDFRYQLTPIGAPGPNPVEQDKPANQKHRYLHPDLYGAPENATVGIRQTQR